MVLGQVGEDAHIVMHAVDPVQSQGVGRDLHHHMGAARVPHPGEEPLKLKGLRRGPFRGQGLRSNHILVGADQSHLLSPGLQNGLEKIGGGGFAVGAGDTQHDHGRRRMAEEIGARHRQSPAGIRHLDIRDIALRHPLAQHRRRATLHGLADEIVAVHGEAGHGHKQVPRPRLPRIVADIGNLQLQVRRGGENVQAPEQFTELHAETSW